MRVLALTAALATFALASASVSEAAEPGPRVAAGSAFFEPGAGSEGRVFRFSAVRTKGRAAVGWATVEYRAGRRLRMAITCMHISGKRALFAGKVRSSTIRAHVGRSAAFVVEDGGPPARDLLTLVYVSSPSETPYTCSNYPAGMVLLKPTKGAVRIGPSKAESA
jgi:hypothetical protein